MSDTTILIYTEGHEKVGYGHLIRCLTLAAELERRGATCRFVTPYDTAGYKRITDEGYVVYPFGEGVAGSPQTAVEVLAQQALYADAIIFDLQGGVSPDLLQACGETLTADLNLTDHEQNADLIFHPLIHDWFLEHSHWDDIIADKYSGPEYAIVRKQFSQTQWNPVKPPRIFVAGGAYDSKGVILKVVEALDSLKTDFTLDVMVSRIYSGMNELAQYDARHPLDVHIEPEDVWYIMAQCTLGVMSFGVGTVFEAMAVGLPVATLSISDDHDSAANELEARQGMFNLGMVEDVSDEKIRAIIADWLFFHDHDRLQGVSQRARNIIDGRGAQRIAEKILERIG